MNFSEMTQAQLRRCGADNVGIAMGIHIHPDYVTPLEASPCRYWFRIGEMYFDVILNEDSTMSLYVSNENDDVSIQIASFQANGSIIRGDIMDGIIRAHAEALDTIDDMVDVIGKQIIRIAYDNRDFICSRCLSTAYALFGLMEKYAREEDTADIRDKWKEITGADIKEWR